MSEETKVLPTELRMKASAALQEQIARELEVEDPKEKSVAKLINNDKE